MERSKAAKNQATEAVASNVHVSKVKQMGKFVNDQKLPRYVLYGVIMLKSMSIYDKMKQLVAINQMSTAIVKQQSQTLREHFDSEEELSDLMTKRMLENQMVNDVEDDLGP